MAVTPSTGGTQRLPRVVGLAKAKELLGDRPRRECGRGGADPAGDEVVASGHAAPRAHQIGEEIAERGPLAVREVKALVDAALDRPLNEGHAAEIEASVRVFGTQDMVEGALAFREKRAPRYEGH